MQSSSRPRPFSGLQVRLPQSYSQDENRNFGRGPSNVVNINGSRNKFNNVNFSAGNSAGVSKSKSSAMECESPNFLLKDRLESLHEEISTKNKELISLQNRAEELQSLIAMSEEVGAKVTTEYEIIESLAKAVQIDSDYSNYFDLSLVAKGLTSTYNEAWSLYTNSSFELAMVNPRILTLEKEISSQLKEVTRIMLN